MSFETPKKRVDSSMERGTMSNELAGLDDVRFQIERKLHSADLLENGIIIGNDYRILRLIAEGGMSDIYEATHPQSGSVALKVVPIESVKYLERLHTEAEIMSKLKHENITQIYASFNHGSHFFVAMELLGKSFCLDKFSEKYRGLAEVFSSLAQASHYIHDQGILHRDLTPENVLFNGETPKIIDFGLAAYYRDNPDSLIPKTGLGTICYVSPEQAEGSKPIGPQTDIYSLGAMLYEYLAKQPRFHSLSWENAVDVLREQAPPPPSAFKENIPEALNAICMKCLEIRPEDRYATANDLAIALDSFCQSFDQSDLQ